MAREYSDEGDVDNDLVVRRRGGRGRAAVRSPARRGPARGMFKVPRVPAGRELRRTRPRLWARTSSTSVADMAAVGSKRRRDADEDGESLGSVSERSGDTEDYTYGFDDGEGAASSSDDDCVIVEDFANTASADAAAAGLAGAVSTVQRSAKRRRLSTGVRVTGPHGREEPASDDGSAASTASLPSELGTPTPLGRSYQFNHRNVFLTIAQVLAAELLHGSVEWSEAVSDACEEGERGLMLKVYFPA